METNGTHDGQIGGVVSEQPESPRPSMEDMIQFFFETITDISQNIMNCLLCSDDLSQNISKTLQCIEDAKKRGQCGEEVIKDSIDKLMNITSSFKDIGESIAEAKEDIENFMNSLQDGSKSNVDQINFYYSPGGFRTMKSKMLSMKATLCDMKATLRDMKAPLLEIQDAIQESGEASRSMEKAAILLLTILMILLALFISF